MIHIEVDEEFLDLPPDLKIRLKFRSQVFERKFVVNSYSYPIALQWTPVNARAMRYYDRLPNTATFEDIPCKLFLGGDVFQCTIKYRGFKQGYEVDLNIPPDPIISEFSGRMLQELEYGGPFTFFPSSTTIADWNTAFDSQLASDQFIYAPIRNTGIFGGREETYRNAEVGSPLDNVVNDPTYFINRCRLGAWLHHDISGDPSVVFWHNDFTPFPFLSFIFEQMLAVFGYKLTGDVFDIDEVRSLVIISNMYQGVCIQADGSGSFVGILGSGYSPIQLGRALPYMTCIEFLVALMGRFNAVPVFAVSGELRFRSMNAILDDVDYLDITEWVEPAVATKVEQEEGFTISQESEPLESGDRNADFDDSRIIATVDHYTGLAALTPVDGNLARVRTENAVYQFSEDLSPQWVFYAHYIRDKEEDNSSVTFNAGVALTRMWKGYDGLGTIASQLLIPEVDMIMSDRAVDWHFLGRNDITKLRLLFYRGLQDDEIGDQYPLLSTECFDYAGNPIPDASMTETIEGDAGIYATWYRRWVEVRRTAKHQTTRVRMPMHIIRHFDFSRKVRINSDTFLVESIDVEATHAGTGVAQLELLHIVPRPAA